MRRHLITATTLAIAATALLTGCSGNNLEGTYQDALDDSMVMVLGEDGTCGFDRRYNPDRDGPTPTTDIQPECEWELNGDRITIVGVDIYGYNELSLAGTITDDDTIEFLGQSPSDMYFVKVN